VTRDMRLTPVMYHAYQSAYNGTTAIAEGG